MYSYSIAYDAGKNVIFAVKLKISFNMKNINYYIMHVWTTILVILVGKYTHFGF